ncbi:MAG: BREX-3 system P-loop-containing protein BrxF [Caldisericota bacterium]|nr:BREX-3 system P-loop-containing protein BrxF [Caldisericota bacterium]
MDIERLNEIIDAAKLQRSQLVIICNPNKEKLTKQNNDKYCIQNVNISLELSKKLMDIPKTKRSTHVRRCLAEILHKFNSDVLWIERMQILFHPELEFDPIQFFQNASRNIIIILSWDGEYKDNKLIYAKPGHREYRVFSEIDAQIFGEI